MTELPKGWAVATFESLLEFALGGDWGKAPEEALNDSTLVRCIRASELKNWESERGKTAALRRVSNTSLEKRRLQVGDILVEISGGGPDQAVGRTVLITPVVLNTHRATAFVCTNFFRLCRPYGAVNAAYLNWFLTFFYRSGGTEGLQGGSNNLRNLRFPDFVAQNVPIPPTNEQRRIVEKIEAMFERIDKGVENLRGAKATLALYRQSLLKSAFEGKLTADWRAQNADQLETPKTLLARIQKERETRYKSALDDWQTALAEWRAGGEVGRKPSKPSQPRSISLLAKSGRSNGFWPTLELGDIISVSSGIGLTSKEMKDGPYPVYGGNGINGYHNEYSIESEELVIGRVGAKCGVTHISRPRSWITDNALIATPLVDSFDKHFFKRLLETKDLNRLGSSTGQPVISGSKIYPVTLELPCLAEQAEITRILDTRLTAADRMEAEIDAALSRADALRQSILKRAFAGNLVPQDPTDEPAPTLLARIKAERPKAGRAKPARKVSA